MVTFHPFFHISTSSTRSCTHHSGPLFAANLRKCAVVVGRLNASLVDNKLGAFLETRGLGLGIVIPVARMALGILNGCFVGVCGVCAGAGGATDECSDLGIVVATFGEGAFA